MEIQRKAAGTEGVEALERRVARLEGLCIRLLFRGDSPAVPPDCVGEAVRLGLASQVIDELERQGFRDHFLRGSMSTVVERLLDAQKGKDDD